MEIKTKYRPIRICNKCGWTWVSKKETTFQCPACRSWHWNDEKETKNKEGVVDE
jgi:predicted RNA-binding Zn-ribbon protein involved in translation (DUF1610 family)